MLTAEHVRKMLADGRAQLAGLAAGDEQPPVLLFAQEHPDGPDGVVAASDYLAWKAAQPGAGRAALTLSLTVPQLYPVIGVIRDGVVTQELFTGDDDAAARRYLELAAEVLGAAGGAGQPPVA